MTRRTERGGRGASKFKHSFSGGPDLEAYSAARRSLFAWHDHRDTQRRGMKRAGRERTVNEGAGPREGNEKGDQLCNASWCRPPGELLGKSSGRRRVPLSSRNGGGRGRLHGIGKRERKGNKRRATKENHKDHFLSQTWNRCIPPLRGRAPQQKKGRKR